MTNQEGLTQVIKRLAEINTEYLRTADEIPASVTIASRDKRIDIIPLESIDCSTVDMISDAFLTVTCTEGYMMEALVTAPLPDVDDVPNHPDARRCVVYLAQARDGTRACAVQYILKPEHGRAKLSPLKVLNDHNVALMDSDIADLTRPGQAKRSAH